MHSLVSLIVIIIICSTQKLILMNVLASNLAQIILFKKATKAQLSAVQMIAVSLYKVNCHSYIVINLSFKQVLKNQSSWFPYQ